MNAFFRRMPLFWFWVLLSFLYAVCFVGTDLWLYPVSSFHGLYTRLVKWIFLSTCASGVVGLVCLNRYIYAILWPLLALVSTVTTYFVVTIGVGLTSGVVELAMANGFSVWYTLVSGRLVMLTVLALFLSVGMVWYRWRHVTCTYFSQIICLTICLPLVIFSVMVRWSKIRDALASRLPYALYYSFDRYADNRVAIASKRTTYDQTHVERPSNAPDVFFILGESLRADHLPFNGYTRNTMPLLSRDTAVISFPHTYSEACYTHASIPIIMTDSDSLTRVRTCNEQSFISLYKRAGYRTAWFANQDFSKSYAPFGHEADTIIYCTLLMTTYTSALSRDIDMLPYFDGWMKSDGAADTVPRLAVFHTIGSHWWYKSHYPDTSGNFLPEVDGNDVASLSHEQMVNSYDNTILETDRFVHTLIERIKDRNAILIFMADHGENIGECGVYLHANDCEPTHRPACFVWYSPSYEAVFPDKVKALKRARHKTVTTDAMFHTVLDAAGLKTDVIDLKRSLFWNTL